MSPGRRLALVALAAALAFVLVSCLIWPAVRQTLRPGWKPWTAHIERWAAAYAISPDLVAAVVEAESSGRPRVVSGSGALGLMQLMPATAEGLAAELGIDPPEREDIFRPDLNVKLGTYYLAKLMKRYGGDPALAITAYHAGPTNLDRWIAAHGLTDARELLERLDAPRTSAYLDRVLAGWERIAADRAAEAARQAP